MINPINYIKECINNVNTVEKDIVSIKEEIKNLNNRLDEIKLEQDSASFKWYDVKGKSTFTENLKSEKKLIKTEINKLKREIKDLEKQKIETKNKRDKVFLFFGVAIFVILMIISIIIGSINEKINPKPEITNTDIETISTVKIEESTSATTEFTTVAQEITTEISTKSTTESTTKITTEKIVEETIKETKEFTTSRSQKIVYGSKTGNHYHKASCRYANGAEMTVSDAERRGWDPCGVCNP